MSDIDQQTRTEIEAAVFQRMIKHFQDNTDVQNIDLMILANFCRNCLSKWYAAAASERGIDVDYDEAREVIYGMPYNDWKEQYQKPATPEQMTAFEKRET